MKPVKTITYLDVFTNDSKIILLMEATSINGNATQT